MSKSNDGDSRSPFSERVIDWRAIVIAPTSHLLGALRKVLSVGKPRLCEPTTVGLHLLTWVKALLLTLATFALLNLLYVADVHRAYRHARLRALDGMTSKDEAVRKVLQLCHAPTSLAENKLIEEALYRQQPRPCRDQLLSLFAVDSGANSSVSASNTRLLDDFMTGRLRGWPGGVISARPPSGAELQTLMMREDPSWRRKYAMTAGAGSGTGQPDPQEIVAAKEKFLAAFVDLCAAEVRPSLRQCLRINGWVQWWTIYVFWLVMVIAFDRWQRLRTLVNFPQLLNGVSNNSLSGHLRLYSDIIGKVAKRIARRPGSITASEDIPANIGSIDGAKTVEPAETANLLANGRVARELVDRQVYGTLSFMLGLLPSLGFIGTVIGMGDALLTADGLFHAEDKTAAVGEITRHLGFAFDTTLVGLMTSIIAGSTVLALRVWETSVWELVSTPATAETVIPVVAVEGAPN